MGSYTVRVYCAKRTKMLACFSLSRVLTAMRGGAGWRRRRACTGVHVGGGGGGHGCDRNVKRGLMKNHILGATVCCRHELEETPLFLTLFQAPARCSAAFASAGKYSTLIAMASPRRSNWYGPGLTLGPARRTMQKTPRRKPG